MWTRRRPLPGLCAAFADAYGRLDESRATSAFRSVVKAVPRSTSDELGAGLLELIPLLEHVQFGNGKLPADLVAGLIEEGADPLPVLDVLVARIVDGFDQALRFPAMAERIGGTFAPPTNSAEADALRSRLVAAEPAIGPDIDEAMVIAQAWFSIDHWIPALLMPLQ